MLTKKEKSSIKLISQQIYETVNKFDLLSSKLLSPTNFAEEKKKFFSSETYNPQFKYISYKKPNTKTLNNLYVLINEANIPNVFKNYYKDFLNNIKLTIRTSNSVGTEGFAAHSEEMFKWTLDKIKEKDLIDFLLDKKDPFFLGRLIENRPLKQLSVETVKNALGERLKQYGIKNYPVISDNKGSSNIVYVTNNALVVGSNVKVDSQDLKRLIIHEIDSHILQKENAHKLGFPHLAIGDIGEKLLFSEGFAVFNEYTNHCLDRDRAKVYVGRFLSTIHYRKSFREIFNLLEKFFTKEVSFQITFRVKRGIEDTSKPGGYLKEAAYLYGYLQLLNLIDSPEKYAQYFIGKITPKENIFFNHNLFKKRNIILPPWYNIISSQLLTKTDE